MTEFVASSLVLLEKSSFAIRIEEEIMQMNWARGDTGKEHVAEGQNG